MQLKGIDISNGNTTFGELITEWKETKKATVSANTFEGSKYYLKHLEGLNNKKITEAAKLIQRVINQKSQKMAPASIRKIWSIARQIFELAYDRDIIMKIPRVKLPKLTERIPEPITIEQMNQLIQAAEKHSSKYVFGIWLEFGTGLRRSEMLALDWKDIDFNNNTITVSKALVTIEHRPQIKHNTKTQAGYRIIPVPAIVMDKLKELPNKKGYVFKTSNGTPLNPWNWSRLFRSWRKIAGLEHVRFHDLRHQFATLLMQVGTHARVAQNMTGHADMPTLLERYTHVQPELMKEAAQRLNEALKPLE